MKQIKFTHLPRKPHYYGCPKCRNCCFTDLGADYAPLCPTYHYYHSISRSGAGMNKIAANLFEGNITLDADVAANIYSCLQCFGCDARCPMSCRPTLTNRRLRRELIAAELAPPEPLSQQLVATLLHHNRFGLPHADRFAFLDERLAGDPNTADLLLYCGSDIAYGDPQSALATARILHRLGLNYAFARDERDSGFHVLQSGYREQAEELLQKEYKRLLSTGKTIICLDPADYYMFTKIAPPLGLKGLPVHFIAALLADKITDQNAGTGAVAKKSAIPSRTPQKIVWHDPCTLGRGCGMYDEPRAVLAALHGVERLEMPRNRADSWCCGAGAQAPLLEPDLAAWTGNQRIAEAVATGATTIVTVCSRCEQQLANRSAGSIRVINLMTFVEHVLGEENQYAH